MATRKDIGLQAFKSLPNYLEKRGWIGERVKGEHAFEIDVEGEVEGERYPIRYFLLVEAKLAQFLFYICPEYNMFDFMLPKAAEYVCRANLEIKNGNLELDFDDGGVCFKSSMDFRGETLSHRLINRVIDPALKIFDQLILGLLRVVAGIDTPAEAVRKIKASRTFVQTTTGAEDLAAFEALQGYLKDRSWNLRRVKGKQTYCVDVKGDLFPIRYFFKVEPTRFLFRMVPRIALSGDKLPAVAEYFCRVNHGLRIGHFDLDFRDGQISFASSIYCDNKPLSPSRLDGVVAPALTAFDEFLPGLVSVIEGRDKPGVAIRKVQYGTW